MSFYRGGSVMVFCGRTVVVLGVVSLLLGCTLAPPEKPKVAPSPQRPPRLELTATQFDRLAGWSRDDGIRDALGAFRVSCAKILTLPPNRSLLRGAPPHPPMVRAPMVRAGSKTGAKVGGWAGVRAGDWRAPCRAARHVGSSPSAARHFFETHFSPYLVSVGGRSTGLFTGYYEAELRGSHRRHGRYQYPVYALPQDLVRADVSQFSANLPRQTIYGRVRDGRLVPYYTRRDIYAGALRGRAKVLLWVDDPVDAFFLHVQGSGRVRMDDGSVVRLGFAGRNGYPYRSIGKILITRGEMRAAQASMSSIRDWVKDHPKKGRELLAQNPSYIFFKKTAGDGGPIGALGVPLTPGRSLAVDRRFIPMGMPVWLETTHDALKGQGFHRLMVAQDTGGAITGGVRGDIFFGFGPVAARMAGSMKSPGRYYVLLPR